MLAELLDGGALACAGVAGDDQAPTGGVGASVEHDQPAAGLDDLVNGRGGDHDKAGMVGNAPLVVGVTLGRAESGQPGGRQQLHLGWLLLDECRPALLRGRRLVDERAHRGTAAHR
ncbi:hypothetical protein ABGB16_32320 [Micromonospora sp. B11E3]|uniref:hypothetical protein n=1 Tax=Micromonospora sp. B11E3 TaxID=3153562 RepID=UPI00325E382A